MSYLHHYIGRIEGPGGWRHHHPFWQIEYVRRGPIVAHLGAERVLLLAGDLVLVPPFLTHAFKYPDPRHEFISIKFEAAAPGDAPRARVLREDPRVRALGEFLWTECAPGGKTVASRVERAVEILQDLVCESPEPGEPETPSLAELVRKKVRELNGAVQVKELARHAGMSEGNLRLRFAKETGVGLKKYIDEARAEFAERMLLYGDRRVSEVAEALGFADVFAFSRFFRRQKGSSPREFRRRAGAGRKPGPGGPGGASRAKG